MNAAKLACTALLLSSCAHVPPPMAPPVCDGRIGLRIDKSVSSATAGAIDRAIAYWNDELGHVVLFRSGRGDVVVEEHAVLGTHLGRFVRHIDRDCAASGHVLISAEVFDYEPAVLDYVARHELGHLLGLPDEPGITVMMPRLPERDMAFGRWPFLPEASPDELFRLWRRYGHPNDYFVPGKVPAGPVEPDYYPVSPVEVARR